VFLGCTIRKKRSILRNPRAYYMHCWPSPKVNARAQLLGQIEHNFGAQEIAK